MSLSLELPPELTRNLLFDVAPRVTELLTVSVPVVVRPPGETPPPAAVIAWLIVPVPPIKPPLTVMAVAPAPVPVPELISKAPFVTVTAPVNVFAPDNTQVP